MIHTVSTSVHEVVWNFFLGMGVTYAMPNHVYHL
jgi:hypothetical protein